MKTMIPLAIGGLLVVLLVQDRVPAQDRKSLEARVLDLEQKVAALEKELKRVLESDNHKWSINQESDAVKDARKARQEEFKQRYQ